MEGFVRFRYIDLEGGGMDALIDDDLSTYWQSAYEGGDTSASLAVIDMQTPKRFPGLNCIAGQVTLIPKCVELYVSDQPDANTGNWTKIELPCLTKETVHQLHYRRLSGQARTLPEIITSG